MRQIDHNLPHTHHLNQEAAQALGLKWSKADRTYIREDGTIPAGYEGDKDSRWGELSESDTVHAHR